MSEVDDAYGSLMEALCDRLKSHPHALSLAMQAVHDCAGLLIYVHRPSRKAQRVSAARALIQLPRAQAVNHLMSRFNVSRATAYRLLVLARRSTRTENP